ncbi:MAG: rRNA maturation RNase YbeY [Burkholderiales bacterium]|jgi:probable rRNA maturation factor|nr:rRNA maturation RNase YbeY [Burkholderiales bacterium]
MPRLSLTVQGGGSGVPSTSTLRRWIAPALARDAQLTLRFVSRVEGRRLNREFRGKDYATNVLTFDYQRRPMTVADIVLCLPVLRAEARAQRKKLRAHLAHLILHGVLHAQGYDHQTDAQERRMVRRERQLLAQLGVAAARA